MNKIYDNGALMLGNVQMVIMEIERQKKASIDMFDIDIYKLLKDLKELRDIDYEMVVCINYDDIPYGEYKLDVWSSKDIVKGGEE